MINSAFLITSIIVILLPGPGSIYTVSTAININKIKSIFAAIGCTFGILPHLLLGIVSMVIMQQLPTGIMSSIKIIGAIYLIYLGYSMINGDGAFDLTSEDQTGNMRIMTHAVLINLLNPKLTLFFISFIPQFISDSDRYLFEALQLGIIFMLLSFLIFACYSVLANVLSNRLLKSPNRLMWMNRLFGATFIVFAIRLFI